MSSVYLEIDVSINPIEPWGAIMIAQMSDFGFESFLDTEKGFKAYMLKSAFSKNEFERLSMFSKEDVLIKWTQKSILPQNWNEKWERGFIPIKVGDDCLVRADFHSPMGYKYELVITPKMSFGTGHHQTTQLMLSFLLKMDCREKKFLDMGSGTGVLSILADKKGASYVHAVDIDPWCVENALENMSLNDCKVITTELNSEVPTNVTYDVILANINRNILIDQIPHYARIIVSSGVLLLSGFYVNDLIKIQTCCKDYGFKFICNFKDDDWIAAKFIMS